MAAVVEAGRGANAGVEPLPAPPDSAAGDMSHLTKGAYRRWSETVEGHQIVLPTPSRQGTQHHVCASHPECDPDVGASIERAICEMCIRGFVSRSDSRG